MATLWNTRKSRQLGIPLPKRSPVDLYKRDVISKLPEEVRHRLSRMPFPELSQNAPKGSPAPTQEDILQSLISHLQVALLIELSTIPLYLYPYYSVKNSNDPSAVATRGMLFIFSLTAFLNFVSL